MNDLRRWLACAALAASVLAIGTAAADEPSFEDLLSYIFFEDERAIQDPTTFICHHIALPGAGDTCKASFRIIDANACKVEVTREFRATHSEGKGREFMQAKEIFTVANLDLARTLPEYDRQKGTTRARFQADIDIYRHEGYQYSFELNEIGAYQACRIDGKSIEMPEAECVAKGTKAPSTSKKMSLLFSEAGFDKAMAAVRRLQTSFCPAGGNKT